MKYKGIIFDLDGTLADTLEDIAGSMNKVLKSHRYTERPVEEYKNLVGRGLDNLVKQALPESARHPEIIDECLLEMMSDYEFHCLEKTGLYEGISELLSELKARKLKMAVFSNKAEPLTIKIVDSLLKNVPFIKVSGARKDFPKKPDPTVALRIAEIMNLQPHEIIYMGDSDVDMQTARNSGMMAVGVLWGFRSREELLQNGAKVLLRHPNDLLKYLKNQGKT